MFNKRAGVAVFVRFSWGEEGLLGNVPLMCVLWPWAQRRRGLLKLEINMHEATGMKHT